MERYRFTFADGSTAEEFFDSDNEAIVAATAANGGSSGGLHVQRYDHLGALLPTKLPPGGHRGHMVPEDRHAEPGAGGGVDGRSDVEAVKGLQDRRRGNRWSEDMKEYSHGCR